MHSLASDTVVHNDWNLTNGIHSNLEMMNNFSDLDDVKLLDISCLPWKYSRKHLIRVEGVDQAIVYLNCSFVIWMRPYVEDLT